jgi:hypothetical protein
MSTSTPDDPGVPGGVSDTPPPVLHGFACASCTEPGSAVNPAVITIATAKTAAIKRVFFILVKMYESIRIFEVGRKLLHFRGRDISETIYLEYLNNKWIYSISISNSNSFFCDR